MAYLGSTTQRVLFTQAKCSTLAIAKFGGVWCVLAYIERNLFKDAVIAYPTSLMQQVPSFK